MEHVTLLIEHDEDRKSETTGIVETLHQLGCLLLRLFARRLPTVIVYVEINEIVAHHLVDGSILLHEVGEPQAPRAPVAAQLAYHELTLSLGFHQGIIYLSHRVDGLVIHFLQRSLREFAQEPFH